MQLCEASSAFSHSRHLNPPRTKIATGRDGKSTYILYFKVIWTTFTLPCRSVTHSLSPHCSVLSNRLTQVTTCPQVCDETTSSPTKEGIDPLLKKTERTQAGDKSFVFSKDILTSRLEEIKNSVESRATVSSSSCCLYCVTVQSAAEGGVSLDRSQVHCNLNFWVHVNVLRCDTYCQS